MPPLTAPVAEVAVDDHVVVPHLVLGARVGQGGQEGVQLPGSATRGAVPVERHHRVCARREVGACIVNRCACVFVFVCMSLCLRFGGWMMLHSHGDEDGGVDVGGVHVNVNVNVLSLGLSNATEEQQVYAAIRDMPMLQGVCTSTGCS